MPETRRPTKALSPRRWLVQLVVVDTPGPGEDYLTAEEVIDNAAKRKTHPGVEIVGQNAMEQEIPTEPEPVEELNRLAGTTSAHYYETPAPDPITPPAFTTLEPVKQRGFFGTVRRWLGMRHR